jgi:hypothetical protein
VGIQLNRPNRILAERQTKVIRCHLGLSGGAGGNWADIQGDLISRIRYQNDLAGFCAKTGCYKEMNRQGMNMPL